MAQIKTKAGSTTPTTTSSTTSKQPTAAEMREWYEKNKRNIENYAKAKESAITNLKDVTKNQTKTVSSFNKETLRQYLKNISSNEKNLRNLSRYLYYRSQAYYRLILYNANMFELGARIVVPQYDLLKPPSTDQVLKDYYETLNVLDSINLQQELLKAYITCFREDVFYGCVYYDDTSFFILPLDPDYMKINGYVNDGSFAAYMDMTYFRSRQETLEDWGEPFTSMYKEYGGDNQKKWVLLPPERGIVLKCRTEDYDLVLPVFAGMLNSIINLIDLEDISAIADAQEIYKLIFLEMQTLTGAKNENEFSVSPDIMLEYFDRMINECLPDYVSAALVPGKLESISLNDTAKVNDTNKIIKSTESLFNSAGGSMLNGATASGTTAITLGIKADTKFALSALLPQTQTWLNRFLKVNFKNPAKVKFLDCSAYTKDELRKNLLESCQYGFSNILAYNTLNNVSERDTIALNYLENDCLDLVSKFRPLQSSHTISGSETGAPVKDATEITDDGEKSRQKRETSNG